MDETVYEKCTLFRGLNAGERARAARFLGGAPAEYKKGDFLVRPGERMTRFALVLSGAVSVMMDDMNGRRMIMASASAGDTFGESLCYLEREDAPVYVCASIDCRVLWMRADALKRPADGRDDFRLMMTDRFIRMLAGRALSMNDRIQILSKGSLRDKLTTFFAECAHKAGSREFDLPLDRSAMAAYLAADRSALSRELSAMRREGLLEFSHNHFKLRGNTDT